MWKDVSYSMAGGRLVRAPVDLAVVGIIRERALSDDQGPSLRRHGNMFGHSDAPGVRAAHRGNVNNQGFGDCFSYKRLNVVINYSDFVILGLYLLIYGSDTV